MKLRFSIVAAIVATSSWQACLIEGDSIVSNDARHKDAFSTDKSKNKSLQLMPPIVRHLVEEVTVEGVTGKDSKANFWPPESMKPPQENVDQTHPSGSTAPMGPYIDARYESMMTLDTSGFIPPDPSGAAGPKSLVAVVNVNIEALDKDGAFMWTDLLFNFFSSLNPLAIPFDPKIVYDTHENRFVVVALDSDFFTYSSILLAVSKNDNPMSTSDWFFHKINSLTIIGDGIATFSDYPGFEVDEEAIYITNNMFSDDGFEESRLWVVDKGVSDGFYSGGTTRVVADLRIDSPIGSLGTYQPAEIRASDPSGVGEGMGTYLVSYSFFGLIGGSDNFLSIVRVDDPLGSPTLFQNFVNVGPIGSGGLNNAPQRGIDDRIETNDNRVLDAVYTDGTLWCVLTVDQEGETTATWVKMNIASVAGGDVSVAQADGGTIDGEDVPESPVGTHTYFPSIAVNGKGIAAFGFAASSPTIYGGAYVVVRDDNNDDLGTVQASEVVREGVASYVLRDGIRRNRWGDYTGIAVDPVDDECFWVFNQYANAENSWGTAWARLCVREPTPEPTPAPTFKPTKKPTTVSKGKSKGKRRSHGKRDGDYGARGKGKGNYNGFW